MTTNIDKIQQKIMDDCESLTYLGVIFNKTNKTDIDVRFRIVQIQKTIVCPNGMLWRKHITKW